MDHIDREKTKLRTQMKKSLKLLAASELAEKSARLCACLATAEFWPHLRAVAAFLPLPGEPDLRPLLEQALREGKSLLLPRIDGEDLVFHEVLSLEKDLVLHAYGMPEPAPHLPRADFAGLAETLFLVPGLAFDRRGHRLGRGKGFYDRFLRRRGAGHIILGTAFSCRILKTVPFDENDFLMTGGLVTDEGVILF
ncbi:MAG: 5-formyltetrahydrofolate cyclo-ligase [Spirochaetales bacterium]|nr:5-formyltetrahydrofolate cyclo-ligase [Spirochaetales bacterium]